MAREAKAVEAPFSTYYDQRFFIVDAETGEILDDAQGYGYRSAQKAHAAWAYKNKPKKKRKSEKQKFDLAKKFLDDNPSLSESMEIEALYSIKDGEKFNTDSVRRILEQYPDLDPPVSAFEILKAWRKL